MEMAFTKKGGMKDDGMDRDPVSGNDIPVGSTAKEVRDDIPAMLSEGEYVVPADVVQYYGVKMFEDLRIQAKLGLQDMENNGRIGGEPVDEDLGDDEQAVLMEIMQMNTGGVVGNNSLQNPTGPEGLEGDALRQYALSPTQSSYITPGALQIEAATAPRFSAAQPPDETVPVCPAGQVFDKEKNMCVPIETPAVNRGNDDPNHPLYNQQQVEKTPWHEKMDWENPMDYYQNIFEPKGINPNKIVGGLGIAVGGPVGAIIAGMSQVSLVENIAQMRGTAMMYRAAGETELANALLKKSDAYVAAGSRLMKGLDKFGDSDGSMWFSLLSKSIGGPDVDALMKAGKIDDINAHLDSLSGAERRIFKNYLAQQGFGKAVAKAVAKTPRVITAKEKAERKKIASDLQTANIERNRNKDNRPSLAERAAAGFASKASQGTATQKEKAKSLAKAKNISKTTAEKLSGSQMKSGSGIGEGAGGSNYAGPMNKGGLMTKKKQQR